MTATDSTGTADREIVLTRIFDAPRELVFEAYTDARHLDEWWGPRGFVTKTIEHDARVGGAWRFTMLAPDGTVFPNRVVYTEVVRPERLAYLHDSDVDDDPRRFQVTVTFADLGGRTELTSRMLLATPEQRAQVVGFGAIELGYQTLDRFAEHLASR
jgi:uncharacterized protein YndB with AHSA1/START domain